MSSFDMLGLSPVLLKSIQAQGFDTPTAVQSQAIPHLMNGHDLIGISQTGGGKTAAFVLPMLQALLDENKKTVPNKPRALILAPTRELAQQIGTTVRSFAKGEKVFHTVIYGGAPYRQQLQQLQRGVHIIIATPGRLMDHIERGSIRLDDVGTFILDEADRMLDMGFINDVKKIASLLPAQRQTVMFSATMSKAVHNLADGLLEKPKKVEIERENTVAETIDHRVLQVSQKDKSKLLHYLLEDETLKKVLIFTRTKAMADRLNDNLRDQGRKVDTIHGDRVQAARQKVLRAFRNGNIDLLVATDVAARGIDVSDITHVINYDMPLEGDAYVHRIGRTGRAGQEGTALSFCTNADTDLLKDIEKTIKQRVNVEREHPFHSQLDFTPVKPQGRKRRFGGKPTGKPGGKPGGKPMAATKAPFKKKAKKVKKPNLKGRAAA